MLIGRIWLTINCLINLTGTILMFIEFFDIDFFEFKLTNKYDSYLFLIGFTFKLLGVSPYVIYYYYWIIFEHCFVDSSILLNAS